MDTKKMSGGVGGRRALVLMIFIPKKDLPTCVQLQNMSLHMWSE